MTKEEAIEVRKFEGIEVTYPPEDICTYPEYKGKPYFGIRYKENGESIVGYGTYNPQVLSRYLKDYFMPTTNNDIRDNRVKNELNRVKDELEPTTKNDLPHCQHTDEEIAKSFIEDVEAVKDQLHTKNDLGVDCISRKSVITIIQNHWWNCRDIDKLVNDLPSVTLQESILDKIRAEIDKAWRTKPKNRYEEGLKDQALKDIQIIDKYKAESENI